jgi:hypothetical protein
MGSVPPPRATYSLPTSQRYFVGLNRAELRGSIWLGAVLLAIWASFSWPDWRSVTILALATGGMVTLGLWAQGIFSEVRPRDAGLDEEPREGETGDRH